MKKIIFAILACLVVFSGCSKEKKEKELVITIPLVTWGGYAALFAANGGASPNEESLFYKNGGYKVELVQVEDPSLHLQGFSNGSYPIIWSTMDMLPLQYDSLSKDVRTIPKVIGVFDYSAGGDGIVARNGIKNATDMVGKTVVLPQYQPSHYFFLWYLDKNNIDPTSLKIIYAEDAIKAKDTYVNDSSIDICVTWSPFIYDITDSSKDSFVKGSELIMTTAVGSEGFGVIADVYVTRADFLKKNPDVIKAFVKSMIEGYELFLADKSSVAQDIASLFGIPGGVEEVMLMFGDVVIGGKEENSDFFNDSLEISGFSIFQKSSELYKKDGKLPSDFNVDPKQVISGKFMLDAIK
ncbi:MAG: ABC transporter substrate-binding protein [Spirochaetales bacterium]|nr:ABC transporter substrate-binding protein [Spirochaetales bacterium]